MVLLCGLCGLCGLAVWPLRPVWFWLWPSRLGLVEKSADTYSETHLVAKVENLRPLSDKWTDGFMPKIKHAAGSAKC